MSGFNDRFSARAVAALAALGAETITYTPAGGAPVSLEAIVSREGMSIEGESDDRAAKSVYTVQVTVPLASVAAPARGDKLSFDPHAEEGASTLDWAVVTVGACFGGLATLTCEARIDETVGRPGFRRAT